MILINLLPHREAARKRRLDIFNLSLALAVVVGIVLAGLVYLWFQTQISLQQKKNELLQTHIKRFDGQIKDIASLEAEIAALRARQQAVEDLQADRNLPVHLLSELVRQLPDGMYFTAMRQDTQNVVLQGVAQSNERVSELMRNLAHSTPWFGKPELVEIVAGAASPQPGEQRRVANFTLRVRLLRASEAQTAGMLASTAPLAAPAPRP